MFDMRCHDETAGHVLVDEGIVLEPVWLAESDVLAEHAAILTAEVLEPGRPIQLEGIGVGQERLTGLVVEHIRETGVAVEELGVVHLLGVRS
jgi:hypothetical protein